jgi:hypothetical protein
MDPIEKAVMDAYLAAATRKETDGECLRAAVETWLALHPGAEQGNAMLQVNDTLRRLRLVEDEADGDGASAGERRHVIAAWDRAKAIGLHPDNCLARAVEAWLKEHPDSDRPTAERRVARIIDLARNVP